MKIKTAIISAAVFLLIFTGCSKKNYDITVTAGGSKAMLDGLETTFAAFREKTGIRVKLFRANDSLNAKDVVTSQVMNKQAPSDLLITDGCYVQALAAGNIIDGLSQEYSAKAPEFFANVFSQCVRGNDVYAVPLATDAYVIFCLADTYKKAGVSPPSEFSQILSGLSKVASYHRKINQRWLEGPFISYSGAQTEALVETFMALSGGINVSEGKVMISEGRAQEAVNLMRSFKKAKKNFDMESLTPQFLMTDFMQRRSLLMIAPVSDQAELRSELSPVKDSFIVIKIPENRTIATSLCAAIPSNSGNKGKAKKLLSYLASQEGQVQLSLNCGLMPALRAASQDAQVSSRYPHAVWYFPYAEAAAVKPVLSNYQYVSERLREAIVYSIPGVKTVKEAFGTIEKEVTPAK